MSEGAPAEGDELGEVEAVDAALDAVEPERLLPGEQEDTMYLDDAQHWAKVYSELLGFKRSLLTMALETVPSLDDIAASEIEHTDLKVLRAEAARFERRLDLWRNRVRALEEHARPTGG